MDNLEAAFNLLKKAANLLPEDNVLSPARSGINKALITIEEVQVKRNKRIKQENFNSKTILEKWKKDFQNGIMTNPPLSADQANNALKKIDQLIATEEAKMKEPDNNDNLETIFN